MVPDDKKRARLLEENTKIDKIRMKDKLVGEKKAIDSKLLNIQLELRNKRLPSLDRQLKEDEIENLKKKCKEKIRRIEEYELQIANLELERDDKSPAKGNQRSRSPLRHLRETYLRSKSRAKSHSPTSVRRSPSLSPRGRKTTSEEIEKLRKERDLFKKKCDDLLAEKNSLNNTLAIVENDLLQRDRENEDTRKEFERKLRIANQQNKDLVSRMEEISRKSGEERVQCESLLSAKERKIESQEKIINEIRWKSDMLLKRVQEENRAELGELRRENEALEIKIAEQEKEKRNQTDEEKVTKSKLEKTLNYCRELQESNCELEGRLQRESLAYGRKIAEKEKELLRANSEIIPNLQKQLLISENLQKESQVKIARYEEFIEDLEDKFKDHIHDEKSREREKNAAFKEGLQEKESELQQYLITIEDQKRAIERLLQDLETRIGRINELESLVMKKSDDLYASQKHNLDLEKRLRRRHEREKSVEIAGNVCHQLQTERDRYKHDLQESNAKREQLATQLTETQNVLSEKESELLRLEKERSYFRQKYKDLQQESVRNLIRRGTLTDDSKEEVSRLKSEVCTKNTRIAELQRQLDRSTDNTIKLQNEDDQLIRRYEELQNQLGRVTNERDKFKEERDNLLIRQQLKEKIHNDKLREKERELEEATKITIPKLEKEKRELEEKLQKAEEVSSNLTMKEAHDNLQLQQQIEQYKTRAIGTNEILERLKTDMESKNKDIYSLRNQVLDLENRLQLSEREGREVSDELQKCNEILEHFQKEYQILAQKLNEEISAKEELLRRHEYQERVMIKTEDSTSKVKRELEERNAELRKITTENKELKSGYSLKLDKDTAFVNLRKERDSLKAKLEEATAAVNSLHHDYEQRLHQQNQKMQGIQDRATQSQKKQQEQIDALTKERDGLLLRQEEIQKLKSDLLFVQEENDTLSSELKHEKEKATITQSKSQERLQREKEEIQSKLLAYEHKAEQQQLQIKNLGREKEKLQNDIKSLETRRDHTEKTKESNQTELIRLQTELQSSERENKVLQREKLETQKELEKTRKGLNDNEKFLHQYKADIEVWRKEREDLLEEKENALRSKKEYEKTKVELDQALASLSDEKDGLKRKVQNLTAELDTVNTTHERKQRHERDLFKENAEKIQNQARKMEKELETMKNENITFRDRIKFLERSKKEYEKTKVELDQALALLSEEKDGLKRKVQNLTAELDTVNTTHERKQRHERDLFKENTEKLQNQAHKIEKELDTVKNENITFRDRIKFLESHTTSERGSEIHNEELQRVKDEVAMAKRKLKDSEDNLRRYKVRIETLQNEKDQAIVEKESALTRLSALAGDRLRDNNAAIADLSDENRPINLGEKFSELYDNQWTDAMENLEGNLNMTELDAIQCLLRIIQAIFEECVTLAADQLNEIAKVVGLFGKKDKMKRLKDFRKSTAADVLPDIIKIVKDRCLSVKFRREAESCKSYISRAVELCWYMQIQDPPVILDFSAKKGDVFDDKIYRHFTKSGKKIDYMVWPVMFLHLNGPLLQKGVVQPM